MKHLVACSACARQYDASGRAVGSRFRCHCGEVVQVPAPRSHEARVVRCSSCGGPRTGDEASCGFCGSSFTLRERDLQTVCPACFARISDRARFCSECGTAIAPEDDASELTERTCPVCPDSRLSSRRLGADGPSVLECGTCAGLWLGAESFSRLEEEAQEEKASDSAARALGSTGAARTVAPQAGPLYRPCVVCGTLMHRLNYGKRSGVIIDVCKEHGVWFDAEELERILAWIRAGGLQRSQARDAEIQRDDERLRRLAVPAEPRQQWQLDPGQDETFTGSLLMGLAGWVGREMMRRAR